MGGGQLRGAPPWSPPSARSRTKKLRDACGNLEGAAGLALVLALYGLMLFFLVRNGPRWGRFSEHMDFTLDESVVRELTRRFIEQHPAVRWHGDVAAFAARFPDISPFR